MFLVKHTRRPRGENVVLGFSVAVYYINRFIMLVSFISDGRFK